MLNAHRAFWLTAWVTDEIDVAGPDAAMLLDDVERDSREALRWTLNQQEQRLIAARLKHLRRIRREYLGRTSEIAHQA